MQVLDYLGSIDSLKQWQEAMANQTNRLLVLGLNGSLKTVALEQALRTQRRPLLVITGTEFQAQKLVDEWRAISQFPVHLFPVNDIFSAEMAIASKESLAERIKTLDFVQSGAQGAVVATAASLKYLLPDPKLWQAQHLQLRSLHSYDFEQLKEQLQVMGYTREFQVEKPGDFSIRGSIIDIYPLTFANPVRIDFFDDEIDSIRYFDFTNQKSLEPIDDVVIPPATDFLRLPAAYEAASQQLMPEVTKAYDAKRDELAAFYDYLYTNWSQQTATDYDRAFISYFYPQMQTLFDYLQNYYYIVDDFSHVMEAERQVEQDVAEWQTQKMAENKLAAVLPVVSPLRTQITAQKQITFLSVLQKGMGNLQFEQLIHVNYQSMTQFFGQLPLLKSECDRFSRQQYTVLLLVSSAEKRQKLAEIMADLEVDIQVKQTPTVTPAQLQIIEYPLLTGFELTDAKIAVITEKEIFNSVKLKNNRRHREQLSNAERLKSYNELKVGDYVVHVNHGIGKYLGMETLEVDGNHQDYMTILYQNDDKLFIPVTQLDLIQKYVAQDGKVPKINKLGGKEWHKTKQKASKQIDDIADELLELYAKREALKGFAFSPDNEMQQMFEDAFPYVETDDQLRSTAEIKHDMEKIQPMDRLLVGDVGYGKTEVALRAACKAVQDQKQVAFLVPTTILAQQHYETIKKRFADLPVNVGILNRFRSRKEQKETLEELQAGQLDIIVGTHRILSQDVEFHDLGLLIIDEEQRFGVKHKERLKQLKNQVDVLTLTATPIPRTLHMSMIGVRDLSVLETPPKDRFPVQTYVMERHFGAIKEAVEREMARGGQVFYLFNRVNEMEQKVQELQQILPEARIGYAHGQMTEVQLETILMEFLDGYYDVLVTTTIVETGVDIPNVNTIFVDHADQMGLSQLYQLRGRVGRSNRVAYAYFMYEPMKVLTEVGEKRLEAIKEFTALGSGFKIAMRDLSIRGAGNLLGAQQHGFMNAIGFDLYTQMLEEAIMKKRGEAPKEQLEVEVNVNIDAYLPETYLPDGRLKIEIYKRLKEVKTVEVLDDLESELLDRFGDYPSEVSYLLSLTRLKLIASTCQVEKITLKKQKLALTITAFASKVYQPLNYMEALKETNLKVRFNTSTDQMTLEFLVNDVQTPVWLAEMESFLQALAKEYAGLVEE